MQHLQSKTVAGLLTILALATILVLLGKLTQEMVEVMKWVGGSYMGVRLGANLGESFGGNGNTKQ